MKCGDAEHLPDLLLIWCDDDVTLAIYLKHMQCTLGRDVLRGISLTH